MTHAEITRRALTKTASELLGTIGEEASRMFRSPLAGEGLFGKKIMDLAREEPMMFHTTPAQEGAYHQFFSMEPGSTTPSGSADLLSKFKSFPSRIDNFNLHNPRTPNPGVIMSPTGSLNRNEMPDWLSDIWEHPSGLPKNMEGRLQKMYPNATILQPSVPSFAFDKLQEAGTVPAIPQTLGLHEILSPRDLGNAAVMRQKLTRALGPQWILKDRFGLAADAGSMATDAHSDQRLLSHVSQGLSEYDRPGNYLYNTVAQVRNDLKPASPVAKWFDDKLMGESNIGRGTREVRVHAINGKVVPYASLERGNTLDYLKGWARPWRSGTIRDSENLVQDTLDRMHPDDRKGAFGFDIGIKPDGSPFVIETNASAGGVGSDWFDNPHVMDAVSAATQGRLPLTIKMRNAAYGAGVLGAGAAGLHAMQSPGMAAATPAPIAAAPQITQPSWKPFEGGLSDFVSNWTDPTERKSLTDWLTPYLDPLSKNASTSQDNQDNAWRLASTGLGLDTASQAYHMNTLAQRMKAYHEGVLQNPRLLRDPTKALGALDDYATMAGDALHTRAGGIPAHWLMRWAAPSALAEEPMSFRDMGNALIGRTSALPDSINSSLAESRAHYKAFAGNPRMAMTQEILTGKADPTATMRMPGISSSLRGVLNNLRTDPDLPSLPNAFPSQALRAPGVVNAIRRQAGDLFLGGQSAGARNIDMDLARGWGLTPYAEAMEGASKGLGVLGLAGMTLPWMLHRSAPTPSFVQPH